MLNKINNLKVAKDLNGKMFAAYSAAYSDCNRNFTGNVMEDVEIQKDNIEEGQKAYNRMQEINKAMTKAAMIDQDAFDKAVVEAGQFIESIK